MIITEKPKKLYYSNELLLLETINTYYKYDSNQNLIQKVTNEKDVYLREINGILYKNTQNKIVRYDDSNEDITINNNTHNLKTTSAIHSYDNKFYFLVKKKKKMQLYNDKEELLITNNKIQYYYLHKKMLYYYFKKAIYGFDLITKEVKNIYYIEKLSSFTVNDDLLAYSEGPRVYLYNMNTNNKKEYHTHMTTVRKLYIDNDKTSVFSVCKEKIVCFDIYNENKKVIANLNGFIDMKICKSKIHILNDQKLYCYDRICETLKVNAIFINKNYQYKGFLSYKNNSGASESSTENNFSNYNENIQSNIINNKIIDNDLFKEKIKRHKVILNAEMNEKISRNELLVFQYIDKLIYLDYHTYNFIAELKGSHKFANAFLYDNNYFIFEIKNKQSNSKKIFLLTIYNKRFEQRYSLDVTGLNGRIIKCIKIDNCIFILTKAKLYHFTIFGQLQYTIDKVKAIEKFDDQILFVRRKQLYLEKIKQNINNYKIKKGRIQMHDNKIYFKSNKILRCYDLDSKNMIEIAQNNIIDFFVDDKGISFAYEKDEKFFLTRYYNGINTDKVTEYKVKSFLTSNLIISNNGNIIFLDN